MSASNGASPAPTGWDVGIGYDQRFATLQLQPVCPHGERGGIKNVPLAAIFREFGVRLPDVRQMFADASAGRQKLTGTEASICEAAIPTDCSGLTVLDIGGYDGRYAKLCLDRGAELAICLDNDQYQRYGWPVPERLVHERLGYGTYDFMQETARSDLVLFFNVIYHLQNPWAAFEHLRIISKRLAVCSLISQDDQPTWRVCQPFEVNKEDDTVYWVPSESGLTKLLQVVGFKHVEIVGKVADRLALTCA